MNEHTQSGIYDLAQTPSGEIIIVEIQSKGANDIKFLESIFSIFHARHGTGHMLPRYILFYGSMFVPTLVLSQPNFKVK